LPGPKPLDEPGDKGIEVEIGSKVKVEKRTGVVVSGEVMQISDDHLILIISGSNGLEEYKVGFDQIESLEVKKGSNTIAVVLIAAVIVVVVVAVVGAAISKKGVETGAEILN